MIAMPGMYAENVVAAKIKSLYGQRLTETNFNQLMQKKDISEIALYLKNETYYSSVLSEIKEELIHRGQLENMVKKHPVDIYARLMKYNFGESFFSLVYASKNEIKQILIVISMLNSNSMDKYIIDFPSYLNKFINIDLFRLARVKNFDDLLDVVKGTEYFKLLGQYRPIGNDNIDILACEAVLLKYHYKSAMGIARNNFPKNVGGDLCAILRVQVDLQNLMIIYRMKKFFASSPDEIKKYLIPIKTRISKSMYTTLVEAKNAEEVLDELKNVRMLRRYFRSTNEIGEIEHAIDNLTQHTAKRIFRFSVQPVVILLSYMTLLDIEVENLINVIEGIRYSMPAEQIRELLIMNLSQA